jgi:hypothetical protein
LLTRRACIDTHLLQLDARTFGEKLTERERVEASAPAGLVFPAESFACCEIDVLRVDEDDCF